MVTQESGDSPGMRRLWSRALVCGAAGVLLVVVSSSRWGGASGAAPVPLVPGATILVASVDLPAGSVLEDSMLTGVAVPARVAGGLIGDPAAVRGKELLVAIRRGDALSAASVTAAPPHEPPGHRLLTVAFTSADIAADVGPGSTADVVGSFAGGTVEQRPAVAVVATVRVAAVDAHAAAAGATGSDPAQSDPSPGPAPARDTSAVTLECASTDALRIVWARDNGRSLRLIGHASGDATLAPVDNASGRP